MLDIILHIFDSLQSQLFFLVPRKIQIEEYELVPYIIIILLSEFNPLVDFWKILHFRLKIFLEC
jgi:hypothetical protein